MSKLSKALTSQFRKDGRFKGTCPGCGDDFFLADAVLFGIGDAPPNEALHAIQAAREAIKERTHEIAKARESMSSRAEKISQAVNIGKIVEKIVPSFPSFEHNPGDCRALFEPIDYLIFSGLTKNGQVDALFFVDVKSGNARLSNAQKAIRSAIEAGSVDFGIVGSGAER